MSDAATSVQPDLPLHEPGRHASNLELFLDLVFVFAITQVTGMLAHHLTWSGAAESLLMAWLAWWLWTAFTWAGTTIDLDGRPATRVFVLGMIPALLLVAATIPTALTTHGPWFALAYAVVQLWVLALQGSAAWQDDKTRRAFIRYAPGAAVGPLLLVAGGFAPEGVRIWLWVGVAVINAVSAFLAGNSEGQWGVDPVHFAERHALFIIISLGEVLVAIGANVSASAEEGGLESAGLFALVIATLGAGTLWWSYFAYVPRVVELALHQAPASRRGNVARDVGSFGHVPLILGLIAYAVVAKHLVQHPHDALAGPDRLVLAASVLLFVGGLLGLQWRIGRRLARERLVAVALVAGLCAVGGALPGQVLLAGVVLILLGMSILTWRSFMRTDFGRALFG
ncbi:MAG: low temperature requirement protein A [Nocardioides sp.]